MGRCDALEGKGAGGREPFLAWSMEQDGQGAAVGQGAATAAVSGRLLPVLGGQKGKTQQDFSIR